MKRLLSLATLLYACALFFPPSFRAAEFNERLSNLSTRAQVGTGSNVAVVGFVVGQGAPKTVLIRAVGPALTGYGVSGVLADPQIEVFDSAGRRMLGNDNWSTAVAPALPASGATFTSVGAFPLASGTRDAALVTTLGPGAYTAQVSGVASGTGIALVEIYDITGSARLVNLSTRAQVGTGPGILISGLVIAPGAGTRKMLIRAVGPTLSAYGVSGVLADPAIAVLDSNVQQLASNDNWDATDAALLSAAFVQAGAFPFAAGSKDAALLVDLQPGASYTIQVSGVGSTSGAALVEVYDLTASGLPTVGVTASVATTDNRGASPGTVTFSRLGSTSAPLTVYFSVGGSATNGVDYTALPGSVTIPAGATSESLSIRALGSSTINKDVVVRLTAGPDYAIAANSAATVTIFYNPGTLYLASLRATPGATTSTAYGTASVQLSADGSFGVLNITFSNLSSPATAIYLRLGNTSDVGTEVLRIPAGQVSAMTWTFTGTAAYTAAELVQALRDGRIFVDIQTASYPSGEVRGAFIQSSGSSVFTPPAAAPALADAPLSDSDVARFLIQATFGPRRTDIDALAGKGVADLKAWIDAQIALAPSSHLAATNADFQAFPTGTPPQVSQTNRQAAWWKIVLSGPDQLRQRVAFAWSELFVVSDTNGTLNGNPAALANYYDILVNAGLGNFRDLLEQVTLSPVMGVYLSSLRNAKATYDRTGQVLTSPDENYAREVMQLFTIGLNTLQPDGTLKLDALGGPIPTYDQRTITEMAKIFTGWSFSSNTAVASNFRGSPSNYMLPMVLFPTFHEDGPKNIVGGVQLPAGQGGTKDLKDTLDALFNHPNTAPFVARHLIQRLVSSNPSPGYVYRVGQAFADNGAGVRGDLAAVVRAVLLDYEARSSAVAATASFGKLKEPLLRVSAVLRAFNAAANNGRFSYSNPDAALAQAALRAPTVFNFFEPAYVQPGTLASHGLYAPEFQILTDTTAISVPNQIWSFTYANRSATNAADGTLGLQLDSLLPLARNPAALVRETNLILAGGALPPQIADRIVAAIAAMPLSTGAIGTSSDIERVRSAIYLTACVPQGAIQK